MSYSVSGEIDYTPNEPSGIPNLRIDFVSEFVNILRDVKCPDYTCDKNEQLAFGEVFTNACSDNVLVSNVSCELYV